MMHVTVTQENFKVSVELFYHLLKVSSLRSPSGTFIYRYLGWVPPALLYQGKPDGIQTVPK